MNIRLMFTLIALLVLTVSFSGANSCFKRNRQCKGSFLKSACCEGLKCVNGRCT
uniref:U1-poneritoxin-Dq5a n=1 Tax=Dinoponera quadriceps TaxID=609295 RepID=TX5A_DINQU|nr:RecName: Full=U1-poneritoxin-Dq5a; Short=U1-PONTX-Dq5a; AltName: Full=Dinoponera ICK-like toxin; AltName: Full=Poneratoxin; Flags: Precursor [Dinoponera quadriceps]